MADRDIVVTADDFDKLRNLVAGVRERRVEDREHLEQLAEELVVRILDAVHLPNHRMSVSSPVFVMFH